MKAKFAFSVFILALLFSCKTSAQDFNLFNPSNEMYLFSAYDEGANAFRYNPAVLGLGHRLNVTINAFLQNYQGKVHLNEGDFLINSGSFGLAYRNTTFYNNLNYTNTFNEISNNFSLGFGVGNKTASLGILLEYISFSITREASFFDYNKNRFSYGIGFLYRPANFFSTSLVVHNNRALSSMGSIGYQVTTGVGIRPLSKDLFTLLFDFSFIPYANSGYFETNSYKIGINAKVVDGISINGNYLKVTDFDSQEFFNVGLQFDFPHTSLRYNNTFSRVDRDANYSENYPFKSQANHISLTYSSERRKSIVPERKKILEITLSGSLQDYNTEDVFFGIFGKGKRSIHEVIADIDYGANDKSVKGMLLKIYPLATGRFEVNASIEELTNALERFKARGKTITAYFPQDAGPGEYYIATYADNIVLPTESIFFYGLSIEVINYQQFLKKYGIDLQTFHAGKYKLTFQGLLDSTSEEGKEVINRVLDIVYEKMMNRVVVGRNITLDDYMRDKLSQPLTGSEALRLGLVDRNGWYEDAKNIAERNSKTSNIVKSFNRSEWDNQWSEPDRIAIIGVYGTITTGESQPPPPMTLPIPFVGGGRSTGSESVVKQLEDAFSNPKVKVVILRVDSGGGSALASAEINSAIIRLKRKYKKPFIVSMGSAAASGGYYVSSSADKIFSDDLTITGSIGVFTARPNLDSLVQGQKVKVEIFKRGENSDLPSFFKKLDAKEIEIIQGIIDYYYDRFISAIADGRKMTKEQVEQVAEGRVWLGSDAFNKNLVDEIGGLYEAIKYGKKKSKIGNRYKLVYYAVPGGNTMNEIVTSSIIQYLGANMTKMLGFEEDEDGLEIKY